jgi:hypothetical protein
MAGDQVGERLRARSGAPEPVAALPYSS